jgi:alkylation response protein AidB-like acyl-CoA dehydrogenase
VENPESPDPVSFRAEVAEWLGANCRSDRPRREWLGLVVERGYAVPTWPREWNGLGVGGDLARIVVEEFARVGATGSNQDVHNLWANTLLAYGTDALKGRLIGPLLRDEVRMCLLYSEPGAGSDLAALQTRADRDGDEFVVNGQKVWTSMAKQADYGMLVARTDWDVPKHRGISFFFFPMKQPGVEIRPIKQITGEAEFNEVFIDAARVPAENLLGGLNEGWRVLQTALAYERSVMGDVARGPGPVKRAAAAPDSAASDTAAINTAAINTAASDAAASDTTEPAPAGPSGADVDLASLARATGRSDDPVLRQAIARLYSLRAVNRWNALRAKAQLAQGSSSPILSLGKLAMSTILHDGARVQGSILGAEAMLDGPENPRGEAANFLALNAFFTSIGGGTDQIQRNIIGERVLGLPREPEVDRDVPFRDVRKAIPVR